MSEAEQKSSVPDVPPSWEVNLVADEVEKDAGNFAEEEDVASRNDRGGDSDNESFHSAEDWSEERILDNVEEEVDRLPILDEADSRETNQHKVVERPPLILPPLPSPIAPPAPHHSIRRRPFIYHQIVGERPRPRGELEREHCPPPDLPFNEALAQELRRTPGDDSLFGILVDLLLGSLLPSVPLSFFLGSASLIAIELRERQPWFRNPPLFQLQHLLMAAAILGVVSVWTIFKLFTRVESFLPKCDSLKKAEMQLKYRLVLLYLSFSIDYLDLGTITFWHSLCLVAVIDFFASILRMGGTSSAVRFIAKFEAKAYLHNYSLLACLLFVCNLLAGLVSTLNPPPEPSKWEELMNYFDQWVVRRNESFLMSMHLACFGAFLVGVAVGYPKIDIPRRQGRLGRQYMEVVSTVQGYLIHLYGFFIPAAFCHITDLFSFIAKLLELGGVEGWLIDYLKESTWGNAYFLMDYNRLWNNPQVYKFLLLMPLFVRLGQRMRLL